MADVQSFAGGEVRLWIEDGGAIHLKAADSHGDPVELTPRMAKEIADALLIAAKKLDED